MCCISNPALELCTAPSSLLGLWGPILPCVTFCEEDLCTSVLLNHIWSTVTETSGPPALNTLLYPSIFMQCKSRLGFTDVICTGPEGVYGNGIYFIKTEAQWCEELNAPKVHRMLLVFPADPSQWTHSVPSCGRGQLCPFTHLQLSQTPPAASSPVPCQNQLSAHGFGG